MTAPDVMVSGGEGSAFAACLAAREHGIDRLRLLFTDTLAEDTDLYRFLIETTFAVFARRAPGELVARARAVPEWHEDRYGRRGPLDAPRLDVTTALPQLSWISRGLDPWEVYVKERFSRQ